MKCALCYEEIDPLGPDPEMVLIGDDAEASPIHADGDPACRQEAMTFG